MPGGWWRWAGGGGGGFRKIIPLRGPILQAETFQISVGLKFQDRTECGNTWTLPKVFRLWLTVFDWLSVLYPENIHAGRKLYLLGFLYTDCSASTYLGFHCELKFKKVGLSCAKLMSTSNQLKLWLLLNRMIYYIHLYPRFLRIIIICFGISFIFCGKMIKCMNKKKW